MKISIIYDFDSSAGGGHSFLRALKFQLTRLGAYSENTRDADVVLYNSHHNLWAAAIQRVILPSKPFIHRIDGPISLYTGRNDRRDRYAQWANRMAAVTVFQSQWSKQMNDQLDTWAKRRYAVIRNASDGRHFSTLKKKPFSRQRKTRLIAVSWSNHPNKGLDVYRYLDEFLDWSQYTMTYIGRAPSLFRNITVIPPSSPQTVAQNLKQADLFITGSINDPCSNAVIEALTCGLPVIARRSGGHPELVGKGGILFNHVKEVPLAIEAVRDNYAKYQIEIKTPNLAAVTNQYLELARSLQ